LRFTIGTAFGDVSRAPNQQPSFAVFVRTQSAARVHAHARTVNCPTRAPLSTESSIHRHIPDSRPMCIDLRAIVEKRNEGL
jgi:hypothetical protein